MSLYVNAILCKNYSSKWIVHLYIEYIHIKRHFSEKIRTFNEHFPFLKCFIAQRKITTSKKIPKRIYSLTMIIKENLNTVSSSSFVIINWLQSFRIWLDQCIKCVAVSFFRSR